MGAVRDHPSHPFTRIRKNYYGIQEAQWPKGHGHEMNIPQDAQKDRPARPQRVRARKAYPLGYVEDLNDARTPLAGFFSVLPEVV
jgi:hypothetical protein